jgi:hypothetical protein
MERLAIGMVFVQFLIQAFDQFARDGNGLEISYYWSMMFPTLGIGLALLIGRLATTITPVQAGALGAGWLVLLTVGVPDALRLPFGLGFAVTGLTVVALIGLGLGRFAVPSLALFLAFLAWTQIGAPAYDPLSYHFINVSPRYEKMFGPDGNDSETFHRETVWFAKELDKVPDDYKAAFLPIDDSASAIVGIYQPHVTGHLLGLNEETGSVNPRDRLVLRAASFRRLVIFGPPDLVAVTMGRLEPDLALDPPLLDVTHDRDLGYRLVVYGFPDTARLPLVVEASLLPHLVGRTEGSDTVVDEGSGRGYAMYGPYMPLPLGKYNVSIEYTSSLAPSASAAEFDIFSVRAESVAATALPGTEGESGMATLSFEVTNETDFWEFRAQTSGQGAMVIDRIVIGQG